MSDYAMIEGKKVELSKETVTNLKNALGIKVKPEIKMHPFYAKIETKGGYPIQFRLIDANCRIERGMNLTECRNIAKKLNELVDYVEGK